MPKLNYLKNGGYAQVGGGRALDAGTAVVFDPVVEFDDKGNPTNVDEDGLVIHKPQPISEQLAGEIRESLDTWREKGFELIEDGTEERVSARPESLRRGKGKEKE